jgi:hypothetical protein
MKSELIGFDEIWYRHRTASPVACIFLQSSSYWRMSTRDARKKAVSMEVALRRVPTAIHQCC